MKVLVLGGNGFIGSHVVDHLLAGGHEVRVFDRAPESFREPLGEVEYHLGNFDDTELLGDSLQGIDAVCHLISTTVPSTSNSDPVMDVQSNLVGTLNLLEQMRKVGVTRILFLSSGGTVYGNTGSSPITEDNPLNPISSYGVVKLTIEKYLGMYQRLYGLQPVILRPSNPYGERQGKLGTQGLIGTMLGRALKDEPLEIWGDGSIVRDYLHVSDLAKLCVTCLASESGGVFNVGSGEGYSVNAILGMVEKVLGVELAVAYSGARAFDVQEIVLDIGRVREEFGWSLQVSLEDGITAQWEWLKTLRENGVHEPADN
jgi:UDP-glucose 4-epimerase